MGQTVLYLIYSFYAIIHVWAAGKPTYSLLLQISIVSMHQNIVKITKQWNRRNNSWTEIILINLCDVQIFHVLYINFSKDSRLPTLELTIRDTSIKSLKAIVSFTLYTNSLKTNDLPQYLGHSSGIPVGCGPWLGQHCLQTDIWDQNCPHLLTYSSRLCCACLGIILSGRVVMKSTCLVRWIKFHICHSGQHFC